MSNFSVAFAKQAKSDFDVYEFLTLQSTLPMSHRLHYLQMWLEKLYKAYQLREPQQFEKTHQVVSKLLPGLILQNWDRFEKGNPPDMKVSKNYAAK